MTQHRFGLRARLVDAARREVGRRNDAMLARAAEGRHGTRKRGFLLAGAGFAALGSMFGLVSANVLAVNFTTANTSYKVFTDRVAGQNAAGYINVQDLYGSTDAGVAQIGFKSATLNGLCAIATQDLPVLGAVSLMLVAGEPVNGTVTAPSGQAIGVNQLYLASPHLTGDGDQIAKLTLGQSADTLMMDTTPFAGAPGAFGLQAQTMNISNLNADTYGIDLQGQINLPNLKINVLPGTKTYADCATQ